MTEPIKWRDARKVKPDLGDMVLVCTASQLLSAAHYHGSFWVWAHTCNRLHGEVTHWAPMPKGPRKP